MACSFLRRDDTTKVEEGGSKVQKTEAKAPEPDASSSLMGLAGYGDSDEDSD